MRFSEPWTQATLVTTALVAILGFQTSQAMTPCQGVRIGWKIAKHAPPGEKVDSEKLGHIMAEAVSKNPELMQNEGLFSAKVKEVFGQLREANRPACGHGQGSIQKGKKGTKFCLECLSGATNYGSNT
ncbi:hypothetical protein PGT21_015315 [Puccinia graminis f. sp. tritici]|uniref:Uncharacterized protein n=1 Tax=Puccinia graminis f. sp. tritici TaxID=56615 RepID=A0A5B0NP62_PUCGR|nr:hypothetical protein PGT21_015315 [Puccinia graminis f. sp. tritici]KAA1089870.1 hypothetical protein PGTUg99_025150 [Puccinia graminis f. sp. tritici]